MYSFAYMNASMCLHVYTSNVYVHAGMDVCATNTKSKQIAAQTGNVHWAQGVCTYV